MLASRGRVSSSVVAWVRAARWWWPSGAMMLLVCSRRAGVAGATERLAHPVAGRVVEAKSASERGSSCRCSTLVCSRRPARSGADKLEARVLTCLRQRYGVTGLLMAQATSRVRPVPAAGAYPPEPRVVAVVVRRLALRRVPQRARVARLSRLGLWRARARVACGAGRRVWRGVAGKWPCPGARSAGVGAGLRSGGDVPLGVGFPRRHSAWARCMLPR